MVAATVVTTAIAGSTPTVVIANPANAHLSLPIGKIYPAIDMKRISVFKKNFNWRKMVIFSIKITLSTNVSKDFF